MGKHFYTCSHVQFHTYPKLNVFLSACYEQQTLLRDMRDECSDFGKCNCIHFFVLQNQKKIHSEKFHKEEV